MRYFQSSSKGADAIIRAVVGKFPSMSRNALQAMVALDGIRSLDYGEYEGGDYIAEDYFDDLLNCSKDLTTALRRIGAYRKANSDDSTPTEQEN